MPNKKKHSGPKKSAKKFAKKLGKKVDDLKPEKKSAKKAQKKTQKKGGKKDQSGKGKNKKGALKADKSALMGIVAGKGLDRSTVAGAPALGGPASATPAARPVDTHGRKTSAATAGGGNLANGHPRPIRPSPDFFFNRELSWLDFNERVLHEAADPRNPLLERLSFLAISTSNLDEFFMKRVGLLKRQFDAGMPSRAADRMTPRQQLAAIRRKVLAFAERQAKIFNKDLAPGLAEHGLQIVRYKDLDSDGRAEADAFFHSRVFPVLTPLSVDPGHPFPFISNLSTSLGLVLRHPDSGEKVFARVKVPEVLPQFIKIAGASRKGRFTFIGLFDLIRHNLAELFPGRAVLDIMPFRITRNAAVERDEEDAEDLLDLMEEEIRLRKFERVVRLEVGPKPDEGMIELLCRELEIESDDVYEMPYAQDLTTFRALVDLPLPELKNPPWFPVTARALADEDVDIFTAIRKNDILVHHPYESFTTSMERFVREAAADPQVLAIKVTLYRAGKDSPFIPSLIRAAEAGKQVVVIVELKARFDEARNIEIAQTLEKVGVHVVYGMVGLKTHTKLTLIVRNEHDVLRCYAHIGTGNYNPHTAKVYTDLSLFTCNPELCRDLTEVFNSLTGCSINRDYQHLLVAPVNMRERFLAMIRREIEHCRAGRPARIVIKINSLEDAVVIAALYEASQAGVPVDLIVRGFCCLKPGVPGLSDNIRVISIVGRFLEHSRIFHFADGKKNPAQGEFYIGSADLMTRNLLHRVEVVTPVDDAEARRQLWTILNTALEDHRQAWELDAEGVYRQRKQPADYTDPRGRGTHRLLMELARGGYDTDLDDLPPPSGKRKKSKR